MKFARILNGLLRTVSNRSTLTSKKRRRRASMAEQLEARTLLSGNPVANPDTYYCQQSGAINVPSYAGVLSNDTGGNGPLSAVLSSQPGHGTVTLNSDGSFLYSNTSMAMMGDSWQYEAFDGTNYSSPATVSISFMGTYQPQVQSQNYSVLHDHALNVAAPGVLAGSSDPNHIHLTAVLESNPTHGSVTVNADGSFLYTPSLHYAGPDTFGIEASDGNQSSTTATEQITVTDTAPTATNVTYALANSQTFNVSAANGVLSGASDADGDSMTANLVGGPTHGSLSLNADGSFAYTPTAGWVGQDSFSFTVSDGVKTSTAATAFLNTQYSVLSAVDQTKVPVDTIQVARQILSDPFGAPLTSPLPAGGSGGTIISAAPAGGAPATAHNLSLIYNSVLAQPDQAIEADIGLSNTSPINETLTATLTFNGVQQSPVYFNMNTMTGNDPHVHLAQQVSTAALASGRYPWSLTVTSPDMASPATISGAVNVVNDSASPFGKGWDMPGLYRLFTNNVNGVPAGVLLSTGDAGAYYFTQGSGNAYSSPAGPHAFDTLTSVTGGGWQLVTPSGVMFNFNSGGYLSSRVERTGATTTYNWTGSDLTSIVDPFGRVVPLTYSSGLLSSIGDFANSTWTVAHTGANLVSITEPNAGGGSPVWGYGYTGNYLSSVTDPNGNLSSFTLDSYHRLSQTSLPGGASTSATSEQDFGYGSTNQSSPASLTMQTSVTPSSTDANGSLSIYQTDQFGDVISQVDSYFNLTTIQRDANGLPVTITQPPPAAGQSALVTNISHDSMGNETSATGALPSYGTWTFNSFGEWATFTDSTGKEWARTFDSKGDVLTETDPLNNQVSWTYDTYGQPLTMTVPAPNNGTGTETTQYFYDADERLTKILWPDGSTQLFGWNSDDRQTSFTDENGHASVTAIDVLGRAVSVTNAAGGVTLNTFDKDGNILTTSDPMQDVTTNVWNSRSELVQQTLPDPDGAGPLTAPVLTFTYSATGQELTEQDALGRVKSLAYDKLGRLTTETLPDPDGSGPLTSPVITIGYDNDSRKVSETNALSGTTTWAYANADGRLSTRATLPDPEGSGPLTAPVTQTGYDGDGRAVTTTDAMNHTQTTTLNADGLATAVTDNLNHTTQYVLGHLGELLSTTDALSHTTSDQYDSRYRLVQTTAADGGVTQITLDPAGNTTALVDPANNRTTWTFDQINRPLTETNSSGTTTTSYDLSSAITSITDADGRVRDFQHDNLHRLTAEQWMSGTTVVAAMNYAYDAANQLVSASDPSSAYTFGYDGDGNVLTVDNSGTPGVPDVLLMLAYDSMGDRTSLAATVAGVKDLMNSYSYDADQRLSVLQQQGQSGGNTVSPKEVDLAYNALGQFTTIADFNYIGGGPRMDMATGGYSYNAGNLLTGLTYTSNAGANHIDAFGWAYDAANNVTSFTTSTGTASYGYDVTNQLVSATYTGTNQPANESYSFDKNGNRTMSGYSTGSNNLLTSDGTFNYQHDADGNQTVRTRISNAYATDYRTTFSWDYRDRLTDIEYFDNNGVLTKHVHYVYGVFDHLLATEVDTTGGGSYNQVEHYVLDVSPDIPSAGIPGTALAEPLLQFDGANNETIRYLAALDRIFAEGAVSSLSQGDTVTWDLVDNVGSVRYVVDNSGTAIDKVTYNSFGQVSSESNAAVHHFAGYTGGHLDIYTGFVDDYHRWYDPTTGRWFNQDPDGFSAGDADLERYVANNPARSNDPTGLLPPGDPFAPGGPYYTGVPPTPFYPYNPLTAKIPLPPGPPPLPFPNINPSIANTVVGPQGTWYYMTNGAVVYVPTNPVFNPNPPSLPPGWMTQPTPSPFMLPYIQVPIYPWFNFNTTVGGNFNGAPNVDYSLGAGGSLFLPAPGGPAVDPENE